MAGIMARLVTLQLLRDELEILAAIDRQGQAARERERKGSGMPPGVEKVDVPWAGSWWLSKPQRAVVAVLLEALSSRATDVDERALCRLAGRPGEKLRDVFRGVAGWERLIQQGTRPGTYRLAPPPEDGGEEIEGERRITGPE